MKVGSLFAGIGGFDLGFERAGFTIEWQVEIDPWARAILEKHWPHVRRHNDIRTASGALLGPVDVLCGGFPCQDISLAGKGAGIAEGTRSGLWSEYARIIRELRPKYVVVENVAALRSRGLDRVLGDLAACGYDAEWDCIPASAIGAPHRRDRLWLVAHPAGAGCKTQWPRAIGSGAGPSLCAGSGSSDVAHAHREGLPLAWNPGAPGESESGILQGPAPHRSGWWATEPHVGRVAHGVPARVDRLRGLGNAIVPQITEWIAHRILARERALAA